MKPARTLAPTAAPVGLVDVILSALETCLARRSEARLERELKEFLRVDHVFLVSSGQAALTMVLRALRTLRPTRRVVIPAYTCFSVPAAVVRAGLEPVVADVDPATFGFDEGSLRRALEQPDVLCVVPTHLFGIEVDVAHVRTLSQRSGAFVVEDAAQAFGLRAKDGSPLGSMGDVGVFSLGRGKHLTAGGGGIIATSSASVARLCADLTATLPRAGLARSLRAWVELAFMAAFIDPRLYWVPAGLPFLGLGETVYDPAFPMTRLPATAAGALRRWRTRLEQEGRERALNSDAWAREMDLESFARQGTALLRFPALVSSREERSSRLLRARQLGLGLSAMYPSAIHQIPELRDRFHGQRFPGAETLASRLVTLPTHRYVRKADRAAVQRIWGEAGKRTSSADTHTVAASC